MSDAAPNAKSHATAGSAMSGSGGTSAGGSTRNDAPLATPIPHLPLLSSSTSNQENPSTAASAAPLPPTHPLHHQQHRPSTNPLFPGMTDLPAAVDPHVIQTVSQCDWKDKTLWAARQLLGGQSVNGFMRATATVQRIKRQRARQTNATRAKQEQRAQAQQQQAAASGSGQPPGKQAPSSSSQQAASANSNNLHKSVEKCGSSPAQTGGAANNNMDSSNNSRKRDASQISGSSTATATATPNTGAPSAVPSLPSNLAMQQQEEEELKARIMNPRTAKKLKAEMDVGLYFCEALHEVIRCTLQDLMQQHSHISMTIPPPLSPRLPNSPRSAPLAATTLATTTTTTTSTVENSGTSGNSKSNYAKSDMPASAASSRNNSMSSIPGASPSSVRSLAGATAAGNMSFSSFMPPALSLAPPPGTAHIERPATGATTAAPVAAQHEQERQLKQHNSASNLDAFAPPPGGAHPPPRSSLSNPSQPQQQQQQQGPATNSISNKKTSATAELSKSAPGATSSSTPSPQQGNNAKTSTLRKNRKKKLPPSGEPPIDLPEFDQVTGKRLYSKKERTQKLAEVLQYRALRQGDFVAAKVSSRELWILARVLQDFPGNQSSGISIPPPAELLQLPPWKRAQLFRDQTVQVMDVEDHAKGSGTPNAVPRHAVLPLPRNYSEASEWCTMLYRKGSRVLAMYPDTTSLYTATVQDATSYCQEQDDIIVVQFDEDEPGESGIIPKFHIPSRFVVPMPPPLAGVTKGGKNLQPGGVGAASSISHKRSSRASASFAANDNLDMFGGDDDDEVRLDGIGDFNDNLDDLDFDLGLG